MNAGEELFALHLDELDCRYECQYEYAPGRRFRADFAVWNRQAKNWRGYGMHPTTRLGLIEVVGGVYRKGAHGSITGILKDIDRLNAATLNGWYMMRFTPQQVEDGTAKELVRKWLARW